MAKILLLFIVLAALMLYLGFKSDGGTESPADVKKQETSVQNSIETVQQDEKKRIIKEIQKHIQTQKNVDSKKAADTEVTDAKKVSTDTEEEDEPDEDIDIDERAEDYYKKSDILPQGKLVGGADVKWVEPDKSAKVKGRFGLPPH